MLPLLDSLRLRFTALRVNFSSKRGIKKPASLKAAGFLGSPYWAEFEPFLSGFEGFI